MTNKQVNTLKSALEEANDLEIRLSSQLGYLSHLIEEYSGVLGFVDHLSDLSEKADDLENSLSNQQEYLAHLIKEYTGVVGFVNHLSGDGFGFTPESNNDTHIGIYDIIKYAEQGVKLTEDFILSKLYF